MSKRLDITSFGVKHLFAPKPTGTMAFTLRKYNFTWRQFTLEKRHPPRFPQIVLDWRSKKEYVVFEISDQNVNFTKSGTIGSPKPTNLGPSDSLDVQIQFAAHKIVVRLSKAGHAESFDYDSEQNLLDGKFGFVGEVYIKDLRFIRDSVGR